MVELRRYTLKPGARETLVELFDREFVESQEALGMRILGTFRDLDDPDQFVWLRGFADIASRAPALTAFYSGPVWKANSAAANATMVDVDNVLMLRPRRRARRSSTSRLGGRRSARPSATASSSPPSPGRAGARRRARRRRRSSPSTRPNDFPALPVRETEAVVWLGHEPVDARATLEEHAAGEPEILRSGTDAEVAPTVNLGR